MSTTIPQLELHPSQRLTAGEYRSYTVKADNWPHSPEYTLIDLDYPMYGDVVVKCGGKKFDLRVVRKALALVDELNRKVNA